MKNKRINNKIIVIMPIVIIGSFLFLFYGPIDEFKVFWITTSMSSKNHQFLAKTFYSQETIDKVMNDNVVVEILEDSDPELIDGTYNKYNDDILNHNKDDIYKLINIKGKGYRGYLVAIYDPSRIVIGYSKNIGTDGELITSISKRYKAKVVVNASGFYDPDWNSNGAIHHGIVIANSNVVYEYDDANVGGGIIGFDQNNKLILAKYTKEEALNNKIRDAISFGPFLIVNGKKSLIKGNGGWGISPRTAIGQRKDGIVLFLVIDGRLSSSIGASMQDITDILYKYGAFNASNLDGGASSELLIDNKIVNIPVGGGKNGIRKMSTFWIVK